MTTPALQTVYSEIIDEMFSEVEKTTSEFKIHSWKRRAEKLKAVDIIQYKILIAIIQAYENNNSLGLDTLNSVLSLTRDVSHRAQVYRCIGNMQFHLGKTQEALDAYWDGYQLTHDSRFYDSFLSVVSNYVFYDQRIHDMKSLDCKKREIFTKKVETFLAELELLKANNLNVDVYRDILIEAFKIYFSYCSGQINRLTIVADSNLSTFLFNSKLSLDMVVKLNDEMSTALVGLLDKHDYDELLKFPIIFTAENHLNSASEDRRG